jgi:hypothetical protein
MDVPIESNSYFRASWANFRKEPKYAKLTTLDGLPQQCFPETSGRWNSMDEIERHVGPRLHRCMHHVTHHGRRCLVQRKLDFARLYITPNVAGILGWHTQPKRSIKVCVHGLLSLQAWHHLRLRRVHELASLREMQRIKFTTIRSKAPGKRWSRRRVCSLHGHGLMA